MNVLVNDIPTHYQDEGKGPVMLLLHGWGSDLSVFSELTIWAKKDYRVISLDLPGSGKTPLIDKNGWDLSDYIKFVNAFLKKIEVDEIAVGIGHSMGGRILVKALGEKTLNMNQAVLMAAHGIEEPSVRKSAWKIVAKTGKLATSWLSDKHKDKLKRRLYKSAGTSDYLNASEEMKATFKKIISEDLKFVATRVETPVLLIYGDKDDVTPVSFGETYEKLIRGSKLKVITGAGHYVFLDAYDGTTKAMKGFLE